MRNTRALEIKVGIVSVIGIVLLVVGLSLGKNVRITDPANLVTLKFQNSGGIKPSEPVVINGVQRGQVVSVENANGSVIIKASLDKSSDLHADATARITLLEITGGKKIEISPGNSDQPFDNKNIIPGKTPPDIAELVALLGDASSDVTTLLKRVDTIAAATTIFLADGSFFTDIKYTATNARKISDDVIVLLDNNYDRIDESIRNLHAISKELKVAVDENSPKVSRIIDDLETTLNTTKSTISTADNALADANKLILDLNSIITQIKSGDNLINSLIYDPELSKNVSDALIILNELIKKFDQHGVNVNVRLGTRP